MKKIFSYFVVFLLTLILIGEFSVVGPDQAEAGILSPTRYRHGLNIRVPRVRDRNVQSSTHALRATNPDLNYHSDPFVNIYARLQQSDAKYQKRLYKWEVKKYRLEQRTLRREEKEKEITARKLDRARRAAFHGPKYHRNPDGSVNGETSLAIDPREWFTKKIARVDEGGSLSVKEPPKPAVKKAPDAADHTGKDLQVQNKTPGFWARIKRALFGE